MTEFQKLKRWQKVCLIGGVIAWVIGNGFMGWVIVVIVKHT